MPCGTIYSTELILILRGRTYDGSGALREGCRRGELHIAINSHTWTKKIPTTPSTNNTCHQQKSSPSPSAHWSCVNHVQISVETRNQEVLVARTTGPTSPYSKLHHERSSKPPQGISSPLILQLYSVSNRKKGLSRRGCFRPRLLLPRRAGSRRRTSPLERLGSPAPAPSRGQG